MQEKKDRRSKRDKLKDGLIKDIKDRIKKMNFVLEQRTKMNEDDARVIDILENQLAVIDRLCKKEGDENKP